MYLNKSLRDSLEVMTTKNILSGQLGHKILNVVLGSKGLLSFSLPVMKHCIKLYFKGINDQLAMFHKKFILINILEGLILTLGLVKNKIKLEVLKKYSLN